LPDPLVNRNRGGQILERGADGLEEGDLVRRLAAGMGCAILGGRAGLQRLLRTPPWRSLREA